MPPSHQLDHVKLLGWVVSSEAAVNVKSRYWIPEARSVWSIIFIWTCPCKELTSVAEDTVLCYGALKGGGAPLWQSMKWVHELSVFRYLKFTLDQYVESDYTLVYLHHGLTSENKPSLSWLRDAYREFDRKWVGGSRESWSMLLCSLIQKIFPLFPR